MANVIHESTKLCNRIFALNHNCKDGSLFHVFDEPIIFIGEYLPQSALGYDSGLNSNEDKLLPSERAEYGTKVWELKQID